MTTFGMIPLQSITPSLTNPRQTFDPAKLQELADSIAAAGVHTPVLLRPLPASRLEDTAHLQPRPEYELVAGERRYRASTMAKADSIPAMIRELTDNQVLELQLVENLQRDDLTALEEAQGYDVLMQHSGLTAEQVAAKIGKSRSYVFGRLKLLDMGQDCREALRDGLIDASKALLLARIPSTALQAKALREIIRPNHPEGVMSHKLAQEWIRGRYMLKIEQAPFDHTDTTLAPRACTICPTRTGADADLFMDVMGADMCTDPDCYANKVQQHHSRRRNALEAAGHQIIDGEDAKAVMPHGMAAPDGYARLDDVADSPTSKTLRVELAKLLDSGELVPVMIVNPHKENDLIACVPEKDVPALLERAGSKAAKAAAKAEKERRSAHDQEDREAALRDEYETTWRERVLQAVVDGVRKDPEEAPSARLMRRLAGLLIDEMDQGVIVTLCDMLDVQASTEDECGDMGPHEHALREWACFMGNGLTPSDTLTVLNAATGAHWYGWMARAPEEEALATAHLLDATIDLDVSPSKIKAEVQAEFAARLAAEKATAAESAKALLPLPPAAQAKGVRGGGQGQKGKKTKAPAGAGAPSARISEAEAMSGIATAMQGIEEPPAPHAGREPEPGADAQGIDAMVRHADHGLGDEGDDPMYAKAVDLVFKHQKASISLIQRHLTIGYNRAARLLESMEDHGLVSHMTTSGHREIIATNHALASADACTDGDQPTGQLAQAIDLVTSTRAASVRLIKTTLKVGTATAMSLMSAMEKRGIVSACDERGARKVLV